MTVSTCATSLPTRIFDASLWARCWESSAKNDTVKPAGLGAAVSALAVGIAGWDRGAVSALATVAVVALSMAAVTESKVTGTSSAAARGRNPVHQNGNQKS